ncbi:MAG: redoxin family protein [Firmicutes bacterium]|nr:redoxin family protein [Bacillota bacterium]
MNVSKWHKIFGVLVVGALALMLLLGFNSSVPAAAETKKIVSPRVNYLAPDFVVKDLDGNDATLSQHLGKPVFINFFATWCGFCRLEMPYIEKLYNEVGDEVIFMVIDLMESQKVVEDFFAKEGLTVPVYLDAKGASATSYGVRGIPASFFIDADGVIQDIGLGALTEERLRQGLEKILK